MISRENLAFISATFVAVALLFAIGLSRPDWLVEDGLVETTGAMGFAVAALLALSVALRKSAFLTFRERSLLVGTSGLSLLLFLSEISFGARIFDIQMPQMSGGGEFDGGHDIVMVLFRQISDGGRSGMLMAAAATGLVLISAIALLYRFRQHARSIVRSVLSSAFEFRLAVALGMLATAVVLDLVRSHKAGVLEEILEFSASAVLILAVTALLRQQGASRVASKTLAQASQARSNSHGRPDHQVRRSLPSRQSAKARESRSATHQR